MTVRRLVLSVAPLLLLTLLSHTPARAQLTIVESGFTGSMLAGDFSKQIEVGVGPDTCLYYGSFEGLKRKCGLADPGTICDSALTFPAGIAFSTGGLFGNALYVADYGLGDIFRSTGCAAATMWADLLGPGSIAFPPAGSPYGDYLYACEAFDGPIYRVSPTGVPASWLELATLYLRFGPGGVWGTGLYATDGTDPNNGRIVRISSAGAITPLASGFITAEGFDWAFGGDLFVTDVSTGQIWRVKSNGTKTLFATLPGAADVAYRSAENALYAVSFQGGLYRIVPVGPVDAGDAVPSRGSLTILPNPAPGACALRFTTPASALVDTQVWDAAGRLVRRMGPSWRPAGPQSISWDGRNDAGMPVAPGTYFARVAMGHEVLRARVTIVH